MNVGDEIILKKEMLGPNEVYKQITYVIVEKWGDGKILCRARNTGMILPPHEVLLEDWCEMLDA